MENRARELTEAHWGYVKKVLELAGCYEKFVEIMGFHYISAMFHGYNHGWEDATNNIKQSISNDPLDIIED